MSVKAVNYLSCKPILPVCKRACGCVPTDWRSKRAYILSNKRNANFIFILWLTLKVSKKSGSWLHTAVSCCEVWRTCRVSITTLPLSLRTGQTDLSRYTRCLLTARARTAADNWCMRRVHWFTSNKRRPLHGRCRAHFWHRHHAETDPSRAWEPWAYWQPGKTRELWQLLLMCTWRPSTAFSNASRPPESLTTDHELEDLGWRHRGKTAISSAIT